jgi:hypothetical protein
MFPRRLISLCPWVYNCPIVNVSIPVSGPFPVPVTFPFLFPLVPVRVPVPVRSSSCTFPSTWLLPFVLALTFPWLSRFCSRARSVPDAFPFLFPLVEVLYVPVTVVAADVCVRASVLVPVRQAQWRKTRGS